MNFNKFLAGLSPEQKILALCSRLTLTSEQRQLAEEILGGPVNWIELFNLSQRHLVTALLYRGLTSGGLDGNMPADIRKRMHDSAAKNLARNMQKRSSLLKILNRLERQDIETVVLKGNALVHTIYHDESLRTFTDIDLLIPRSSLPAAKAVMIELGYRLATGIYPVADELNEEQGCEWTYVDGDGVIVEIHWDLLDRQSPFSTDPAALIERSVPFLLDGRPVQALTVEDELVHLCIHQFKHHWQRLRDICDINEIASQTEVDWSAVLERSRESGADKCMLYTLMFAKDILDSPVPSPVIEQLWRRVNPGIAARSIFDLIEKNFISYKSPHGFWPVILVDSAKEQIKIIRDNTRKQLGKNRGRTNQETSGAPRLPVLREILASILSYRHLLAQLLGSLVKNTAATVSLGGRLRRGG